MSAVHLGPVLVPCDGSPASLNAAWRGGLVARDLGTALKLLHVREDGDALAGPEPWLRNAAAEFGRHLQLAVQTQVARGDPLAQTVQAARASALVVLGASSRNPLRDLVLGTPAERLIRLSRAPVLVVKRRAAGSYRRVLVPVPLAPHAGGVIQAASRLARDPRIEVLHALDRRDEIGMRACDLPEAVVRRQRNRALQRAGQQLRELVAQAAFVPQEARTWVGFGDAAALALTRERALDAELLVVGKRNRSPLADFLLGSVTRTLLADARADVLVLPLARRDQTSAISSISTQAPMGI